MARIVDTCLVGVDPVLMLTGPIDATRHLLARNDLDLADIDLLEINEAFASVVLAWQRELDGDLDRVNPNGGAIALGHPLGGTGAVLLTKAVHELVRTGDQRALVTMCCGGGLGTGTLLERLTLPRPLPRRGAAAARRRSSPTGNLVAAPVGRPRAGLPRPTRRPCRSPSAPWRWRWPSPRRP